MSRKNNQYTYSQTIGQSTSKPNTVYNFVSYQKEKAPFVRRINQNPTDNRNNNIKKNPSLEHKNFNQRQYQQKLNSINISTGNREYHQQNKINSIRGKNKYIHNVQKKDFDLSTSKEMNKTFQYDNLSYYYSPNFKKNTVDANKNKSDNISNTAEISKKLYTDSNSFEKRNKRENINKREPQKNCLSLSSKMDTLIDEIRTQIKEMKDGRIASQNQMNDLIEEMKNERISFQSQMNALIEEMKYARIVSQNQMNALIEEMRKNRHLSKKQHNEIMEKFNKIV